MGLSIVLLVLCNKIEKVKELSATGQASKKFVSFRANFLVAHGQSAIVTQNLAFKQQIFQTHFPKVAHHQYKIAT